MELTWPPGRGAKNKFQHEIKLNIRNHNHQIKLNIDLRNQPGRQEEGPLPRIGNPQVH